MSLNHNQGNSQGNNGTKDDSELLSMQRRQTGITTAAPAPVGDQEMRTRHRSMTLGSSDMRNLLHQGRQGRQNLQSLGNPIPGEGLQLGNGGPNSTNPQGEETEHRPGHASRSRIVTEQSGAGLNIGRPAGGEDSVPQNLHQREEAPGEVLVGVNEEAHVEIPVEIPREEQQNQVQRQDHQNQVQLQGQQVNQQVNQQGAGGAGPVAQGAYTKEQVKKAVSQFKTFLTLYRRLESRQLSKSYMAPKDIYQERMRLYSLYKQDFEAVFMDDQSLQEANRKIASKTATLFTEIHNELTGNEAVTALRNRDATLREQVAGQASAQAGTKHLTGNVEMDYTAAGTSQLVMAGLRNLDQFICNKAKEARVDFIQRLLSLSARERLVIYYLVCNDKEKGTLTKNDLHSALTSVPNVELFESKMKWSRWYFWKRLPGVSNTKWNKLTDAVQRTAQIRTDLQGYDAGQVAGLANGRDTVAQTQDAWQRRQVGIAQNPPAGIPESSIAGYALGTRVISCLYSWTTTIQSSIQNGGITEKTIEQLRDNIRKEFNIEPASLVSYVGKALGGISDIAGIAAYFKNQGYKNLIGSEDQDVLSGDRFDNVATSWVQTVGMIRSATDALAILTEEGIKAAGTFFTLSKEAIKGLDTAANILIKVQQGLAYVRGITGAANTILSGYRLIRDGRRMKNFHGAQESLTTQLETRAASVQAGTEAERQIRLEKKMLRLTDRMHDRKQIKNATGLVSGLSDSAEGVLAIMVASGAAFGPGGIIIAGVACSVFAITTLINCVREGMDKWDAVMDMLNIDELAHTLYENDEIRGETPDNAMKKSLARDMIAQMGFARIDGFYHYVCKVYADLLVARMLDTIQTYEEDDPASQQAGANENPYVRIIHSLGLKISLRNRKPSVDKVAAKLSQ